ncbi:MAG TPA: YqgE/AlgH family protein [Gammaproteobacteria bacterium]|nr:YqgE/AlgH family protein [Gammaproteobacteria bacterium]
MIESRYLTNHFLIAMPALADPNFFHTVTYICEHNQGGAMGIVVNRPLTLQLGEIFDQLEIEPSNPQLAQQPLYLGGPIQRERVFVIHQLTGPEGKKWDGELTLRVTDNIGVTASRDILAAMASGEFTGHSLVALGYAGWGEGQLEQEMIANSWLSGMADEHILFSTANEQRWGKAAELLGVDISLLSGEAGHG